jgi:hypothetical protein
MSKVAIKGATTGTGTFTIESPATNTDRTLVLPDEAGTLLTSASTGGVSQAMLASGVAGTGPAFNAYGTALQSVSNATWTKIAFNTELFDTNNNYDNATNYRFTPTVAGYYQINAIIATSPSASGLAFVALYKNGTLYSYGNTVPNSNGGYITTNSLVYCNGLTDYVEIFAFQNSGISLSFGSNTLAFQFSGCLVRAA